MASADVSIETGPWERLRNEAFPIRLTVFVEEQNVPPEVEADAWDEPSLHALARDGGGRPIGTARLLPDGHIGRVAVLREARGTGVGVALMQAMMNAAQQRGMLEVVLSAQVHAAGFYRNLGFVEEGSPFEEAGIAHIQMRRRF
jgi:predicted GNAT family N-acyltransferase